MDAGFDVSLIARGAHAGALKANGLRLLSIEGDLTLPAVQVFEKPVDNAPYDLVLVCVKTWQVAEAAVAIDGTLSANGVVVPLQNGVDAADQLADKLGDNAVLSGLCGLVSLVKEPGVIDHVGLKPYVAIGNRTGTPDPVVRSLVKRLSNVPGMSVSAPENMQVALWQKFLFIVGLSGIGSVTRAPIGITRDDSATRAMLEQCINEVFQVGKARGVPLPENSVAKTMELMDKAPEAATASMQRDIAAGKPSELYAQNGAVVRMGKDAGIATPVNSFITASLGPMENKARGVIDY